MLGSDQKQTLHVLAYMLYRMGQEERAERLYRGLLALSETGQPDRLAKAGLAAIAIGRGDGASALEHLRPVLNNAVLSSRQAVFLFMKAQALWLEKREPEARAALNEYLFLASGKRDNA